jgi:hypothetical protein
MYGDPALSCTHAGLVECPNGKYYMYIYRGVHAGIGVHAYVLDEHIMHK